MIVDDSPLHRKVVSKVLSVVFKDMEIIHCNDAFDGWATLRVTPQIDLMILDHHMPYAKGGDFIEKIRNDELFGQLPIIMLTGEKSGDEFLEKGANAYFGKPFDPKKLKNIVKELGLKS